MQRAERTTARWLLTARSITLVIHKNPDGDAVGSAFALMQLLGVPVKLVCQHPIPPLFEELLGSIPAQTELPRASDLYIILDCAEANRTGFAVELAAKSKGGKRILVIDHHQRGNLAALSSGYIGQTSYSSTCEIVAEIINELRLPLNSRVATALLLGLVTDTGAFQHPNTTSRTLSLASELIRHGADFEKIRLALGRRRGIASMRVWGKVLSTVSVNAMGLAIARVSRQVLIDAHGTETDITGLAKYLCSLEGTKAALVLVETENGWRGTLRARDKELHVGRLARILGGQGSKKIAGFLATDQSISGILKDV